jgi:hypothetical protein
MTEEQKDNFGGSETPSAEPKQNRLSERLATVEITRDEGTPADTRAATYGRSHFVNPSGRMVIGARAIAPKLSPMELSAALTRQQLFSSSGEGQRRSFSSGAVALFICALTAGTTVGLAALVDGPEAETGGSSAHAAQPTQQAVMAAPVTARTEAEQPQDHARQVASISPDQQPRDAARFQLVNAAAGNVVVRNASAEPGRPAPLDIIVNYGESGEYAFLMFRGMPNGFKLSTGFRLKESWAVSLRELPGLQLIPPPGYSGAFELEVMLVKGRDTPIESQSMAVDFSGGRGKPAQTPEAAPALTAAAPAPVPHVLTATPPIAKEELRPEPAKEAVSLRPEPAKPKVTVSAAEESQMLDRALNFVRDGDISSARLILEHLARKGSGKAAMALGQTFDPEFFASMNTLGGLRPDSAKAQVWYKMAVDLGQPGAQQRLEGLSSQ